MELQNTWSSWIIKLPSPIIWKTFGWWKYKTINGGLENGGFDLVTDDCGIYFETGYNDAKNWYQIGEATIRVSADLTGTDNIDPAQGEVIFYPGSFLVGEVTNYDFTPYNTTIRVEEGQIVEIHRVYVP